MVLCLVMCTSVLSANTITAFAAGKASSFLDVTSTGMQNGEISYTINLKPNVTKFSGAVLNVEFDPAVLEIKEATPVIVLDEDGNNKYNVYGEYVSGFASGSNSVYSIAYMNNNGVTTGNSEYKGFFRITFKVITAERPSTTVSFNCKEIFTNDDVDNDIRPSDGSQSFKEIIFSTLDNPNPISTELLANGIRFNWSLVDGAEEYTVLRKASNEGTWRTIAEVENDVSSYVDTDAESGVIYTYSVKCGNGYGDSGFYAAGVTQLYLKAATITSVSNINASVRVMWTPVNGAESYAVYRQNPFSSEWTLLEKTASQRLYYEDSEVNSNSTYKYAVAVENGDVSSIVGENFVSHKFLSAPQFTETKNTEDGIRLTWSAIGGAVSYELYKKTDVNTDWEKLTTTTDTTYLDKDVINGTSYFYALKTIGEDVTSSLNSAASVSRIAPPKLTWLEAVGDGVNVYWNKVNGASGYAIYRKARGESSWQKVGTTGAAADFYKDTTVEGGYYDYCVTATVGKSESLMATIDYDVYFLRSPKNVTLKNAMNGIEISWDASPNADYYIIRKIVNDSGVILGVAEPRTNYFLDTDVANLSSYSYSVTAVDANGISSVGNPYTISFCRVLPPVVTNAIAETSSITVTWNPVSGVDSYNIYKNKDGAWVKIGSVASDVTTYNDTDISSGVQYTYTVTAVKNNTESYLGDENSKSATYVNMPSALKASLTATGISLSWTITDDLTNFVVYKRVKGNSEWTTLTTTASSVTTIHDTAVSSGVTYEYAIKSVSKDGTFVSPLSEIKDVTFLSKIATVKVANVAGGVKIAWSKVAGTQNYIIYRRLINGSWEDIKIVGASTTSYIDKTAESGKDYYYTVRAVANGYRSAYQNYPIYYLAAPKITKFDSQVGKGITIKWADVHGAEKYYIYRKTANSNWKKIGTTENLLFKDTGVKFGATYIYTVRAYGNNVASPYYSSGWMRQYTPGTPSVKSVTSSSNAITIKWGKVTGAIGYILYRKADGEAKWSQVAKVAGTAFTDKTVKKNVKYTYTVRAYKGNVLSEYNKTGWSGAVLSTPTVKIANASTGVKVSWSKNKAATGYTVYRATYDAVNRKWSSWKNMGTAKANMTSWIDKSAQSGTTYRYTVRTICGSCKSSFKASSGLLYLKEPKVTISNSANGITLKWTQALQAKGYRIYRAEYNEATGKWSQWKTMGNTKSTVNSWTDKSVVSGVIYRYTVRTVSGKTLSSYTATSGLKYLSTPQLVNVFRTVDGIVLNYQQVQGADGYRIYRKTADTSWAKLEDVSGNDYVTYTDTTAEENVEYSYTVRAFSGKAFSYYNTNGITCK